MINGLGATPLMEQYVFANDVLRQLETENLNVVFTKVGNYMTAIDMAGVSLTLMKIVDNDWLEKLNYSVTTLAW